MKTDLKVIAIDPDLSISVSACHRCDEYPEWREDTKTLFHLCSNGPSWHRKMVKLDSPPGDT